MQRSRRRLLGVPWPDLVVAAALVLAALVSTVLNSRALHPATEVVSVAVAASVVLRTRAPFAMAAVAAAGCVVLSQLPGAATPLWAFAAVLVIAFSLTAHLRGVRAGLALLLVLAATYVIQFDTSTVWAELVFTPPIIVGAPAVAGMLLRRSRDQAERLRLITAELAAEREKVAELAASEERARIARDLHDILAHTLSSIVVQAGAARQLLRPTDAARGPVEQVLSAGRDALTEVRSLLALGTDPGEPAVDHSPRPGLDRLDELVREDGAQLTVTGAQPLSAGLSLAAFRIVQESLTNARRHAPAAAVTVNLDYGADALSVTVASAGPVAGPAARGRGLVGMAERVAAHGGEFSAGPTPDGWVVAVTLPYRNEPQRAGTRSAEEVAS